MARPSGGADIVAPGKTVEDDVPDEAVWMGGLVSGGFDGKTWDLRTERDGSCDPSRQ